MDAGWHTLSSRRRSWTCRSKSRRPSAGTSATSGMRHPARTEDTGGDGPCTPSEAWRGPGRLRGGRSGPGASAGAVSPCSRRDSARDAPTDAGGCGALGLAGATAAARSTWLSMVSTSCRVAPSASLANASRNAGAPSSRKRWHARGLCGGGFRRERRGAGGSRPGTCLQRHLLYHVERGRLTGSLRGCTVDHVEEGAHRGRVGEEVVRGDEAGMQLEPQAPQRPDADLEQLVPCARQSLPAVRGKGHAGHAGAASRAGAADSTGRRARRGPRRKERVLGAVRTEFGDLLGGAERGVAHCAEHGLCA